jgi:hypothetical protein
LDFEFLRFDQKYGMSKDVGGVDENKYTFRLGLNTQLGDVNRRLGFAGKMDLYDLTFAVNDSMTGNFRGASHWEMTATPYYQLTGSNWKARLGVNLMYIGGDIMGDHADFFLSPDISLEAEVAGKTIFYVNAGGEIQSNDPYNLSKRNRYMNPGSLIAPSYTWLDGMLGIRSGVVPGLWFDVFAGYKITEKEVFFVPSLYRRFDYSSGVYLSGFNSSYGIFQPDASLFRAGASLKYVYKKWVDFSVKGIYNDWSLKMNRGTEGGISEIDKNAKAYGRPGYEVTADLTVRPATPMAFTLGYYLGGDRYTLLAGQEYKMKNINDLKFTASCNFNETLGAYLKLNNLLFQKQELWYGYPVQGFSAMAGINLNF